jgi:DUF1680 family protein
MQVVFATAGVAVLLSIAAVAGQPPRDPVLPIRAVPFTQVAVSDEFWSRRIETNRTVTIPLVFDKNDETGRVDNFAIAGHLKEGQFKGQRYNDSDVYKAIEGASYSLAAQKDVALERRVDDVIAKIAAAQEPDGYLFTARTADPEHPKPGIGATRWSDLAVSHELYDAGHLYEAAVAHFAATGKRTLLDVAIRNADLVASVFGPDKRHGFPGHEEIELGLVKLYRATGSARYLELARYFLDQRGRGVKLTTYPPGSRFAIYNDPIQIQAHKPVVEQDEAVGHAVRAMYLYSGMADVAALFGLDTYTKAVDRLWDNVVGRKMYLTGGVGARADREAFGAAYELPNATAYNETCAAVGNVFWNERMFLAHGDAKYLDVLERVLYNGLISGVSLDGTAFFYPNPLESDGKTKFNQGQWGRAPWFDVACCPGNICRFIPSMPGYIYALGDKSLYVNLFVGSRTTVNVGGQPVAVAQHTRYPWDGAVTISVSPVRPAAFVVRIRIPGWANDTPAPGGLYRYLDRSVGQLRVRGAQTVTPLQRVGIRINNVAVPLVVEKGFARLERTWKSGDVITLSLPMLPRRVAASIMVSDDLNKVALERGPLVYCAEWPDNHGHVLDLVLPDLSDLSAEYRSDLLKGVVVIKGMARYGTRPPREEQLVAIPYYAWAHRGAGEMAVWLKRAR